MINRAYYLMIKYMINALKEAISKYEMAPNDNLKAEYAATLGEIGYEIMTLTIRRECFHKKGAETH